MRAFIISSTEAADRRAFMSEQLGRLGIEHEFFDAVRGAEAIGDLGLYDKRAALAAEGRELRAGEVGCALSHARLYAEIERRALPWALILEDDALLHPELPAVLGRLESGIMEQGDLIFLERCDHVRPGSARPLSGRFRIGEPIMVRAGSTAQSAGYVVTASAAAAMNGVNLPVHFPADSWGYYRGLVRFRGVQPTLTLIRQDTRFESTIYQRGARPVFKKNPLWRLVVYDFLAYTALGRVLMRPLRVILNKPL